MACCSNTKKSKRSRLPVNILDLEASRLSLDERRYYRNLFDQHSENDAISREKFPELLGLLGTDISVNFAMRIFDLFSADGNVMWLEDYLKYVDLYHHGNERERCLTTFRLMDENKDHRINLTEFEHYIDLIIGAIKKVHAGAEDDVLTSKDIKMLFNKISNNKEYFHYQDFENVYFKKPQLLSWIDYFKNNDTTFLINLDRNIKLLVILLERFNGNMSKLFNNIIHLNGNTFNFKDAIKEINKFCKAVERIRKNFLRANSDFNIRNFFDNISHPHDDNFSYNINTNHFTTTKNNENDFDKEKSGPQNWKSTLHSKGRDTAHSIQNIIHRFSVVNPEDDYVNTENMNMYPSYIKEQFNRLRRKIQDDNYEDNNDYLEVPIDPTDYVIEEDENENSQSKSQNINEEELRNQLSNKHSTNKFSSRIVNNNLDVIKEENSEIDKMMRDVQSENHLETEKINCLQKRVTDLDKDAIIQSGPSGGKDNEPDPSVLISFKKRSTNGFQLNAKTNTKYTTGFSSTEFSPQNEAITTTSLDMEKYNEEIKQYVSKMIELFDNNLLIVNWLGSSYKWIQAKYICPVIKKEKKKEKRKDKRVNKPISEKIKHALHITSKDNLLKLTDENFAIVLNMIMGIHLSVNSTSNISVSAESDLSQYLQSSKFSLPSVNFNSAQLDGIFYIVTYGSVLFHNIRKMHGIDKDVLIQSLSPQDFVTEMIISSSSIIEELFSTSKSGSLFYHTRDGKYILKTISRKEYLCFKKILPNYFKHILNNAYTLLPKFYGFYKLVRKVRKTKFRFYFLVMDNVFSTSREIQIKYDIKGSKIGREVLNKLSEEERKENKFAYALKDLDLDHQNKKFVIGV